MISGIVSDFDAAAGLGVVVADEGGQFPFHCVEIADGTRTIAVGTAVTFGLLHKLGRLEAARLSPR